MAAAASSRSLAWRRQAIRPRVHIPGPLMRLAVAVRHDRLDRLLAAGEDPASGLALALRAHQLLAERSRRRLATGIDRRIASAQRTSSNRGCAVPVDRDAVLGASDVLAGIAERLRTTGPLPAAAVARLRLLLTDGAGPMYNACKNNQLRDVARSIASGLEWA